MSTFTEVYSRKHFFNSCNINTVFCFELEVEEGITTAFFPLNKFALKQIKSSVVNGHYFAKGFITGGFFLNNQNHFKEKYNAEHLWEK